MIQASEEGHMRPQEEDHREKAAGGRLHEEGPTFSKTSVAHIVHILCVYSTEVPSCRFFLSRPSDAGSQISNRSRPTRLEGDQSERKGLMRKRIESRKAGNGKKRK
jgi:hypothetical protein